MRLPSYLVRGPNGVFHFRWIVPRALRERTGLRVIKRSLRTRHPGSAQVAALALAARYALAMTESPFDADKLAALLARKPGDRPDWQIRLPNGIELSAEGAEDHERVMKAAAWLDSIGALTAPAPTPVMAVTHSLPHERLAMGEGIDLWVTTLQTKNPNQKTRTQKAKAVRDFHAWITAQKNGEVIIADVTNSDLARYFVHCQSLTYIKIDDGKRVATAYAPRHIDNWFGRIKVFFDWAITSGFYGSEKNPAVGHANVPKADRNARAASHGWIAYTLDELKLMFRPEHFATMEEVSARWIVLILLYTGARSNEIAFLSLTDCKEVDGIKVLSINVVGKNKRVKNAASIRQVPVHPDLLELGLWERVRALAEAGETKLFPDLNFTAQNGPANAAQRSFSRLLERLGIAPEGDTKHGVHSFRKNVVQAIEDNGTSQEWAEEYVGHEPGHKSVHVVSYSKKRLPAAVAAKCHPQLNWIDAGVVDLAGLRPLLK